MDITLSTNLALEKCPHCKVDKPYLKQLHMLETVNYQGVDRKTWCIYSCGRCGRIVCAAAVKYNEWVTEYFPVLDTIDDTIPTPAREYL